MSYINHVSYSIPFDDSSNDLSDEHSGEPPDEKRYCPTTGKRVITTKAELRRLSRKAGAKIRVYNCPFCSGRHITNQDKEGRVMRTPKRSPYKRPAPGTVAMDVSMTLTRSVP